MIGVAFGILETFGTARDIERIAMLRVASQLARRYDRDGEVVILERLARTVGTAIDSPSAAQRVLSAALGAALSAKTPGPVLESLLRSTGAVVAAERFTPDPAARDVIRSLAELHVPRAALSLRWPGIDVCKAEAAGFDGDLVYADDVSPEDGILAPFIRLAEALRLPADCIFFVGTDPRAELHPAAIAGMRTIRLDRTGEPYPAGLPPPEFTIATIEEMLPIISGPYTRGLLALRHIMRTAITFRDGRFVASDADVLSEAAEPESDGS